MKVRLAHPDMLPSAASCEPAWRSSTHGLFFPTATEDRVLFTGGPSCLFTACSTQAPPSHKGDGGCGASHRWLQPPPSQL